LGIIETIILIFTRTGVKLIYEYKCKFIKQKRREAGLTQDEFAIRSGLGLRFIRELEQGKETVRMDKVNQALALFGMKAVPGRKDE
jgi:y4mF family transcriptional regulator